VYTIRFVCLFNSI